MNSKIKNIGFWMGTILLIFIGVFFFTSTVYGTENHEQQRKEAQYDRLESEYLKEVKDTLDAYGYQNSGVTMTKIIYENDFREYTVLIHNKAFSYATEEELANLQVSLKRIQISMEYSTFYHEFSGCNL